MSRQRGDLSHSASSSSPSLPLLTSCRPYCLPGSSETITHHHFAGVIKLCVCSVRFLFSSRCTACLLLSFSALLYVAISGSITPSDLLSHAGTVETLVKLPRAINIMTYPEEFKTPVKGVTGGTPPPLTFRSRPTTPQKHGVVLVSSMETPDRLLWVCVAAVSWRFYQGFEVEVVMVGEPTELTRTMLGAFTKFLEEEAEARVTIVEGLKPTVPWVHFATTLRLYSHHYTKFSPDTVVYAADSDLIPLHDTIFKDRVPDGCIWSHIFAGEVDEIIATRSQPKFALGSNVLATGRSTALPACQIEQDEGRFKKSGKQCYKNTNQLAFFSNGARQEDWTRLFPARKGEAEFVADVSAAISELQAAMRVESTSPNQGFRNNRLGFTDQAMLTKVLVDYEEARDPAKDRRVCVSTNRLAMTLGTLYPRPEAMKEWMQATAEARGHYYYYHHGPHRRAATNDAEWAYVELVLKQILPRENVEELNAIRVDVFNVGMH